MADELVRFENFTTKQLEDLLKSQNIALPDDSRLASEVYGSAEQMREQGVSDIDRYGRDEGAYKSAMLRDLDRYQVPRGRIGTDAETPDYRETSTFPTEAPVAQEEAPEEPNGKETIPATATVTIDGKEVLLTGASAFEQQQFKKNNTKLPDGQWVNNTELAKLKNESPEVYGKLKTSGVEAARQLIDAQNKQIDEVINTQSKRLDVLDKSHLVAQVKAGTSGFRIPPVLAGALVVTSTAVDWPVALFIAAVVGVTYASQQMGLDKKAGQALQDAIDTFRDKTGRELTSSDVVNPFSLNVPKMPSTTAGVNPKINMPSTTAHNTQPLRMPTTTAGSPPLVQFPTTTAGANPVIDIPSTTAHPKSTINPPNILIAQTVVQEAERDLQSYIIRPNLLQPGTGGALALRPETTTALSKKMEALANLDSAVQEAVQTGELDSKGAIAYQNARNRYLQSIALSESSVINYASQSPKYEGINKRDLSAMVLGMLASTPLPKIKSQTRLESFVDRQLSRRVKQYKQGKYDTQVHIATQPATQPATRTQISTRTQPATRTANQEATQAQEATQTTTRTATRTAIREATQGRATTREMTRDIERTADRTTTRSGKLDIPKGSDQANRSAILKANGAIAWRMGKVGGRDRWDVIVNPYKDNSDYLMVLGAAPAGAVIATGATSAYRTARMLYGQPPKKAFSVDSGFQDVIVTPKNRDISLDFNPDPKGLTRGDITIGQKRAKISGKRLRISSSRGRITPSRPRIGR